MTQNKKQSRSSIDRKTVFELFTEIAGWLQIFASPFLLGLIIGGIVYLSNPTNTRLWISVIIVGLGLLIGIIWATKVWRKRGTIHFISRIMATPELDSDAEDQK